MNAGSKMNQKSLWKREKTYDRWYPKLIPCSEWSKLMEQSVKGAGLLVGNEAYRKDEGSANGSKDMDRNMACWNKTSEWE